MSPVTVLRHGPLDVRFWGNVAIGSSLECWLYQGAPDKEGYGRFQQGKAPYLAHRLAWELHNGQPFPPGLVALHSCDTRLCCNPQHIRPATIAENNRDAVAKRRHAFGERNGQARLTDEKVLEIRRRRASGETARSIAKDMGVSDSLVCRIAKGLKWTHVQPRPEQTSLLDAVLS